MATSEGRREVAERMRGPFDVCECDGRALINGTLFGMQVCARDETGLRKGMRRLADLIDPTCILQDATWDDGTCTWGCICSACGAKLEYEHAQDLAYCPDCGARNEGARVWNA